METNKNNAKKLSWKMPVVYNLNESKNIEGKSRITTNEQTTTTTPGVTVYYAPS